MVVHLNVFMAFPLRFYCSFYQELNNTGAPTLTMFRVTALMAQIGKATFHDKPQKKVNIICVSQNADKGSLVKYMVTLVVIKVSFVGVLVWYTHCKTCHQLPAPATGLTIYIMQGKAWDHHMHYYYYIILFIRT